MLSCLRRSELIQCQQPAHPRQIACSAAKTPHQFCSDAHKIPAPEGASHEQAAAAMVVGVGSFTDPPELQASPTTMLPPRPHPREQAESLSLFHKLTQAAADS